jgi:hypothetical protein
MAPTAQAPRLDAEQQLFARMRAQLALPYRPGVARVVDVTGQSRTVTFPQSDRRPSHRNPYGPPRYDEQQHRYPQGGQLYTAGPAAYAWSPPAGLGYGHPHGPNASRSTSVSRRGRIVVSTLIALVLGLTGVGGFFVLKLLTSPPAPTERGYTVEQNGVTYSVTSPIGLIRYDPPTPNPSIRSNLKLAYMFDGGGIQFDAVAGGLAHRTVEGITAEAEQMHAHYPAWASGPGRSFGDNCGCVASYWYRAILLGRDADTSSLLTPSTIRRPVLVVWLEQFAHLRDRPTM